jgi:diguanylate cyclase (GGDEF)-like protein
MLTGLANRRRILELLDDSLASGPGTSVAIVDIDRFKAINDTYGHDAGDSVLRHFASTCRSRLGGDGTIGRLGGEEFLLVMPRTGADEALAVIDRLRDGFPLAQITEDGGTLPCAFSAGVAEASLCEDRTSVLLRADRALYRAKSDGRNCTRVADRAH